MTNCLGMVVTQADGSLPAELPVEGRPTINDMATLLAHAMRRPLTTVRAFTAAEMDEILTKLHAG